MGKKMHKEWPGFTPVRNNDNIIIAAKCDSCGRVLSKHCAQGLQTHRRVCPGKNANNISENTDPNVEDNYTYMTEPSTEGISHNATTSRECASESQRSPSSSDDASYISSTAFVPQKKEKDGQINVTETTVNKKLKDREVLKYMLVNNYDWDFVYNNHFKRLLQALDPTYTLPTWYELEKIVLPSVFDELCGIQNLNSSYLMGIITKTCDEFIYCLSFIIINERYFYIDFEKFLSEENEQQSLEQFIIQSAKKIHHVYEIVINFVIVQSTIVTDCELTFGNNTLNIYQSFISLLENLKGDFNVDLKSEQLSNMLSDLSNKVFEKNYLLSDAVEDIFKYVYDGFVESTMRIHIDRFLSPIALASNYLDYTAKGHYFLKLENFNEKLFNFLYKTLPMDAFDGLRCYKDNRDVFRQIENDQSEKESYWKKISVANPKFNSFCNFVLKVSTLPNYVRSISIEDMKKIEVRTQGGCSLTTSILGNILLNAHIP